MARQREPKTIEEAADLIDKVLPIGFHAYIHAQFSRYRDAGTTSSSASYSCRLYERSVAVGTDDRLQFEAATPADLVRRVLEGLAARYKPLPHRGIGVEHRKLTHARPAGGAA